jgi:predicted MPP superfamily phosphohydrolase
MEIKFQFASDLHLEFPENWELFIKDPKNVLNPVADNLLLAGDIFSGNKNCNRLKQEFAKYLQDNWKHVFVIPGNHEYYVSWRNC